MSKEIIIGDRNGWSWGGVVGSISSQAISGGIIRSDRINVIGTTSAPGYLSSNRISTNSLYGYTISCHTWKGPTVGGGGGLSNVVEDTTPQLGGNLDGNTFGINAATFVSSQKISGGSYKNLFMPADYIIGRDGNTYFSRRGRDGIIIRQGTSAGDILNYTFSSVGWKLSYPKITTTTKWLGSGSIYLVSDIILDKCVTGATNCMFDLNGHTIHVNGDYNGIRLRGSTCVKNGSLSYQYASAPLADGTNSSLLYVYGTGSKWGSREKITRLHNLHLVGYSDGNEYGSATTYVRGNGIYIESLTHGTYDEPLWGEINSVAFLYLNCGIKAHNDQMAINAWYGNNLKFAANTYGIWLSGNKHKCNDSYPYMDINAWYLTNMQFQCVSTITKRYIYCGPGVADCNFSGYFWDTDIEDNIAIECHPSSSKNVFNFNLTDIIFRDNSATENLIKNFYYSRYTDYSTRIFAHSSMNYYVWPQAGSINTSFECAPSSCMLNFPIILQHPYSVLNKEVGLGFYVGAETRVANHSPQAVISFQKTDSRTSTGYGNGKLNFRTKVGDYVSCYLTKPAMTIFSGNVGIGVHNPVGNSALQVSGNIVTRGGSVSSQAISGQWRMPIYRTNKPAAAASYDGKMIMSSGGSTGQPARIWVCAANDDGSTYNWVQIGIGT